VSTTPRPHDDHDGDGLTMAELLALPATVDVTTAARALGLGRSTAYELARRNALPCRVLRLGSSYRIPTADLLRVLGIEPPRWDHHPTLPPAA
jgi:excisionase family DNA binding protein